MTDNVAADPIGNEARFRIEGGLAYFPGFVREQVLRFCDLPVGTRDALVGIANEACFFELPDREASARPDARVYVVCMTIGDRSHEARISEPIEDPALARLVSTLRQLTKKTPK